MILKRMKRRHTREDAIALCERLRAARPNFTFGADIIAGFPTETEEMFENSRAIISQIGIAWLHVFPYSAREGTPAAKIPPVKGATIKTRAKILREEGKRVRALHLKSRIGSTDIALFEETGLGRLPDFTLVKLDNPPKAGSLAKVEIRSSDNEHALGILV